MTRKPQWHSLVKVLASFVVLAGPAFSATLQLVDDVAPSPLLAIDRNRETVVDRVVLQWGEALSRANAGITSEQLRAMLRAMRADQLLAASLAGSLDGLRDVIAAALTDDAQMKPASLYAKALGDASQDVVYVPVTPCRLVDTRAPYAAVYQNGGPFTGGEIRTYTLQGGNGVCLAQLPPTATPSAVQLSVFGIPTTSGSGDIEILPQGATFGSSATLVYLGTNPFTSASTTSPVNVGNKQIAVQVRGGGAHLAIDVVGYFRPPAGGYVSSITAGTGLTGGTITSIGTIAADTAYLQRRVTGTCAAGSSIRSINSDGTVVCEADDVGTGTVTSVGTGAGLTGGPITAAGTINLAATQLLPTVACASSQVPSWNGSAWACATPNNFSGNVNLQDSANAGVGNITKPGGAFLHNFGANNVFAGVGAGNFTTTGTSNAAFGFNALKSNAAANNNTAIGAFSLQANTSGAGNSASGAFALNSNTTGVNNSASGAFALRFNTTANNNAALGAFALRFNTTGSNNTAGGAFALSTNVTGQNGTAVGAGALAASTADGNTAVGSFALTNTTTGLSNVAVGWNAAGSNLTGSANAVVGVGAMGSNTAGDYNVVVGAGAMSLGTSGSGNVAIGTNALLQNTVDNNVAIGRHALNANTTGIDNTAVGAFALQASTTSGGNVGIGSYALFANTTGNGNVAVGRSAVASNTVGFSNTGVGDVALANTTTGASNTGIGRGALALNVTGSSNVAVGVDALNNNGVGDDNVGVGRAALLGNTTGDYNAAMGSQALQGNTTGVGNVAIGALSLVTNVTGSQNVAVGTSSLYSATSGQNVAVGVEALSLLTTGTNNVAVGTSAGQFLTTGSNNIMIGNLGATADNLTIRLGTSSHSKTFIGGIRGTTTGLNDAVAVVIDSSGQLGTLSSSARFKEDIRDMGDTTSALMALRPVTFRYKSHREAKEGGMHYGLIAEEVDAIYPGLVAHDAAGNVETVMYQFLAPMLLNEYQKQQRTLVFQAAALRDQEARLQAQASAMRAQADRIASMEAEQALRAAEFAELRRSLATLAAQVSADRKVATLP